MENHQDIKLAFDKQGFSIINDVFTNDEVEELIRVIESATTHIAVSGKSTELFAIRQLIKQTPDIKDSIFSKKLRSIIHQLFGEDYFVVKSIYFDKPATSNWFVAYHQDITVAVDRKVTIDGFSSWTVKQNQFAVQPPAAVLQNNFTIRIHLDDTDANNGALRVIPGSHLNGIIKSKDLEKSDENVCEVKRGGIMIMRPLLFHASGKTVNATRRRVLHIEFSNCMLPLPLQWAEYSKVQMN